MKAIAFSKPLGDCSRQFPPNDRISVGHTRKIYLGYPRYNRLFSRYDSSAPHSGSIDQSHLADMFSGSTYGDFSALAEGSGLHFDTFDHLSAARLEIASAHPPGERRFSTALLHGKTMKHSCAPRRRVKPWFGTLFARERVHRLVCGAAGQDKRAAFGEISRKQVRERHQRNPGIPGPPRRRVGRLNPVLFFRLSS
jgi:hypothetical protein